MEKIITTLTLIGFTCSGVWAQTNSKFYETTAAKVCKNVPNKSGVSCYNTKFDENFKVCKNNAGYVICGEAPSATNSTHHGFIIPMEAPAELLPVAYQFDNPTIAVKLPWSPITAAPQSESYPENINAAYGIGSNYHSCRGYIRLCFTGNNVAEDNLMPYHGCPSPQDDGPEKNNERNINVSNPLRFSGNP